MAGQGKPGRKPKAKGSTQDILRQVPAHLEANLKSLQELQSRLDYDMQDGLAGSPGAGLNPAHVQQATKITDASTKLSRELRALMSEIRDLAGTASLEDKLEAVLRFSQELPVDAREALISAMQKGSN